MKRYGFIYITTNTINKKVYIGQKVYKRDNDIKNPFPSYKGSGIKLKSAFIKYGKENFSRRILCWCLNQQVLDEMEKFFIRHYDSMNPEIGYNLVGGGQAIIPKEMLDVKGSHNPNYGNKWTNEQKENMRHKMIGRYDGKNNPNYGRKWSKEQRIKASIGKKGKGTKENNPNAKQIKCITNGKIYRCMLDLVIELGVSYGVLSRAIDNKRELKGNIYVRL